MATTRAALAEIRRLAAQYPYESQADWGHGWCRVERHRTREDAWRYIATYLPNQVVPTRVIRWASDPGYAHVFEES